MNLTHKREILPSQHPVTGPDRPAAAQAAQQELQEVRTLLSRPSELLASPRMRRRYTEALQAAAHYTNDTQETAA